MNPKDKTVPVPESEVTPVLAPATTDAPAKKGTYKLVDLPDGNHHIPRLGREFTNKELEETPGLLKMLHELKWPHVIEA